MDTATQRRLALLEAEVTTLRGQRTRRTTWRKRLPLALVALLVALVPLGIAAAGPTFSDLGEAAPVHQANIQAIGDAGITTGFDDPANPGQRTYNPKGLVTREEMASFLARTAGLGTNAPIVNAKTAQTATTAQNAANAAQLGGQPASAYQLAGQPVANATNAAQLGGVPASSYAQKIDVLGPVVLWYSFFGLPFYKTINPNVTTGEPGLIIHEPGTYNGAATIQGPQTIIDGDGATGTREVALPLDFPVSVGANPLRVEELRVCFATDSTNPTRARIDRTALVLQQAFGAGQIAYDETIRQSVQPQCYVITPPSPVQSNGALYLRLRINFDGGGGGGEIYLYNARLTLVP